MCIAEERLEDAFTFAENNLKEVPKILTPKDVIDFQDEKSIITYLSLMYKSYKGSEAFHHEELEGLLQCRSFSLFFKKKKSASYFFVATSLYGFLDAPVLPCSCPRATDYKYSLDGISEGCGGVGGNDCVMDVTAKCIMRWLIPRKK
tara:strand:- start:151 stop:591 length:441 start_codon:yes stop_codon:yes gene_type:complete